MTAAAATAWERTEAKILRPFLSADDHLDQVAIRMYADDDFATNATVNVESVDIARLAIAFQIPETPTDFSKIVGAHLDDLRFIVSLEDRTLKKAIVAKTLPMKGFVGGIIELEDEVRDLVSWAHPTRVSVAIVLQKNRKAEVGVARRAGSWLAKKTFTLTREREDASLNLKPADEEWFKSQGLPTDTAYYVAVLDEDLNQPCDQLPNVLHVYVNKSIIGALSRDDDSTQARAIMRAMYTDIVSTVLTVGFTSSQSDPDEGTILQVVSSRLSKSSGVSVAKLRDFAKQNGGAKLRCVVQSDAELTRAIITATTRRQS